MSSRAAACLALAFATMSPPTWAQPTAGDIREVARGGLPAAPTFFSLAVDPQGNVYVGSSLSSSVLRLAPPGDRPESGAACVTETINPAKARDQNVDFVSPKGIAVASDGTVY